MKFNLTCDKGNYRIDFTLARKRKRFYPGTKDETTARQIHKQMVYEWETGQFDLSLNRYRLNNRKQNPSESTIANISTRKRILAPHLLEIWDRWVASLHLSESTKNGHYHYIRQAIKKHNPQVDNVDWFVALRDS